MSKELGKGKARRRGRGLRRGKRGLAEPFWRPREYRRAAREASGKVTRAGMMVLLQFVVERVGGSREQEVPVWPLLRVHPVVPPVPWRDTDGEDDPDHPRTERRRPG